MNFPEFEKGQRVVCIDDKIKVEHAGSAVQCFQQWITEGKIYTVREFLDNDGIAPAVLLYGVKNAPVFQKLLGRNQEPAFASWRFAPVVDEEITTSIEAEVSIDELINV